MFIFAETGAAGDGDGAPSALFELQNGALKEQLPFEELVVVAGLQMSLRSSVAAGAGSGSDPSFFRQLTSISARVKPLARRLLLVLAVPAAVNDEATSVQILDVGEGAVNFVHDVRGCFPTLVRRNPMSYAPNSGDESDNDVDADGDEEEQAHDAEENARKRLKREKTEQLEMQEKANAQREAVVFMDRTRVKLLQSLDELFQAFPIQNQSQVREALLQEEESALITNQSHSRTTCQWLCVDLPALKVSAEASGHNDNFSSTNTTNNAGSTAVDIHNFGLMLSHATAPARSAEGEHFLTIPLPRPPRDYFANGSDDTEADADAAASEIFQDATVLSFGAKREATTHGGGKTPEEMVKNIRMRHASGTFCTLVNPVTTWGAIVAKYAAVLPQVNELQGELRLRRIMGPARNEPVELLLE